MPKFIRNFIITLALLSCTGCFLHIHRQVGNVDTLEGLKSMSNPRGARGARMVSVGRIREMALKEVALSIGAQAGLASRAKSIDDELVKQKHRLDAIFDFNSLILEHNILPPVLLEGRNTFNLADAQTIRVSDRVYKVYKQARFITTPPNWRQYLWMDFVTPEMPNVTLLPKNHQERKIWDCYVEKGWKKGVEQATTILEENIGRIKEDFKGMILYRKLLAMNMVSPPFVSHTELGVTGDGEELHIDDRVLRITALPALNTNSQEWRAAVAKDENLLKQFRQMSHVISKAEIRVSTNTWQPIITPKN